MIKNSAAAISTIIILIVLVIGFVAFTKINTKTQNEEAPQLSEVDLEQSTETALSEPDQVVQPNNSATINTSSGYSNFESSKLELAKNGKVILFFHAAWCPTCRALERDINANLKNIPNDVAILKVNYDTETELKQRYEVTYQHTLVQVNEFGELIRKWSGSPTLADIVAKAI